MPRFDPTPQWYCTDQHCPSLTNTVQHCPSLSITDQHCPSLSNTDQHCPSLSITDQHCPTLSNTVHHCPSLTNTVSRIVRHQLTLVTCQITHKLQITKTDNLSVILLGLIQLQIMFVHLRICEGSVWTADFIQTRVIKTLLK